jgi:hypothetical protein
MAIIKAVRLISGEELIGEVVDESADEIALKNVVVVVMSRNQTGDINIGFVPFAPYCGKGATFDFNRSQTYFVKEVDTMMENQYNSIFGGIVTQPKTILLG